MWELDYKESWTPKNWCFWTVVLEKTLESPLDCKKVQPVHPKEDQPWVFLGRTNVEAETTVLWPPDAKSWLIGKDPDAGKLKAGGEGDDRGWDGWMASLAQWTWVWVNSRSWWWTGRPGMLWSIGSQRFGHDWVTELNWTELNTHIHPHPPFLGLSHHTPPHFSFHTAQHRDKHSTGEEATTSDCSRSLPEIVTSVFWVFFFFFFPVCCIM